MRQKVGAGRVNSTATLVGPVGSFSAACGTDYVHGWPPVNLNADRTCPATFSLRIFVG
jgi:hypothetical protein